MHTTVREVDCEHGVVNPKPKGGSVQSLNGSN